MKGERKMQLNNNFDNIAQSYLFSTVAKKQREFSNAHPEVDIIRLSIGDVTQPLCPAVINALHSAVDDQSKQETFHGYGDEQGYGFLHKAIAGYYNTHGVSLDADEIFVSDGAKSDLGNILDLFSVENTVLVPDPVYPVYVDTNVMAGRKIVFADATEDNGFLPLPDDSVTCDIIYICSPNNPTGAAYDRKALKLWVDYAIDQRAVILYDAAYECFIDDENLPHSIFEIEGAKNCAIEFCSFSKMAGFTGTRCGWTVVPHALADGKLNKMWLRRQTTKFNGVPYIVQKGAAACFTEEGMKQIKGTLDYYKQNALVLSDLLESLGIWYTGGKSSPYLWLKCPDGKSSWEFFDYLLENAGVVGTPGAGFGKNGEGFFRLTSFGDQTRTREAAQRINRLLGK